MWHVLTNVTFGLKQFFSEWNIYLFGGLSEFVESFDSWRKAEVQIDMAFRMAKIKLKGVNVSWQP